METPSGILNALDTALALGFHYVPTQDMLTELYKLTNQNHQGIR